MWCSMMLNSVGVELDAQEADHFLLSGKEKKLVYTQKGILVGCVRKGRTSSPGSKVMNVLERKSNTNRQSSRAVLLPNLMLLSKVAVLVTW